MAHFLFKSILRIPDVAFKISQPNLLSWHNVTRRWSSLGWHHVARRRNLVDRVNDLPKSMVFTSSGLRYAGHTNIRQLSILNHTSLFNSEESPTRINTNLSFQSIRLFHAKDSKVRYLDFRHRFKTSHLRLHLLIIRRQKMKKHKLRKFRRKFKALIAKTRLKREIVKEKMFRVELLTMIRDAENFDPRQHALNKIEEQNNKPNEMTKEEKFEELREKIRIHRHQVDYVKPRHRRADC